jgi:hypothetical protein
VTLAPATSASEPTCDATKYPPKNFMYNSTCGYLNPNKPCNYCEGVCEKNADCMAGMICVTSINQEWTVGPCKGGIPTGLPVIGKGGGSTSSNNFCVPTCKDWTSTVNDGTFR